jgi:choline dehydrogenase-like flavoprotein
MSYVGTHGQIIPAVELTCQYLYGYKNMMVCDGSMLSANLGANPSLTITALTEHAMSFIPAKKLTS